MLDDKIRISTVRRDKSHKTRPHFHRDNEIYFLEEGKSKLFVDTKLYSLTEGSLVFIRSGRIHKTLAGDNNSHVRTVLMFPDSVMRELAECGDSELNFENFDSIIVHVPEIMLSRVKQMFRDIESELYSPDCMSDLMIRGMVINMLINMLRRYSRQSYEYRSEQDMLDDVIRGAIDYIRMNYSSGISLGETASHVNMSPTYFSKKFKRETGVGFKEYLCKYRLRKAEKLLRSEDFVSITDVAENCGFGDSNYFATAFKSEYGMPPNRFRHLSDG